MDQRQLDPAASGDPLLGDPAHGGIPPGDGERNFVQRMSPVAFAVFSLMVVFVLYQVLGGAAVLLFGGQPTAGTVGLFRWFTLLGQITGILLPSILLVRLRTPDVAGYLRLKLPDPLEILVVVVAVFALQQVLQGYLVLQDAIPLPHAVQEIVDRVKELFEQTYRMLVSAESIPEFMFVVLIVAVVPALAEEFLFRGIVQRSMEEAAGGLRGALLAGVIFGAFHLNPFSLVPLVSLGVFFGYLVYRSGNIMLAVAAHFFNNFIACTASYLRLKDDFVVLAPDQSPSLGLIIINTSFFGMVFLFSLLYFIRITHSEQNDTE
jgi:membrane protease YdiL (CAAX protease family)